MEDDDFEWDDEKAETNFRKHGVTFADARLVFDDPFYLTVPSLDHLELEECFVSVGSTPAGAFLSLAFRS